MGFNSGFKGLNYILVLIMTSLCGTWIKLLNTTWKIRMHEN